MSMAKFLHSQKKSVIATDIDEAKADNAEQLNGLGIETQIGYHDQKIFDKASVMVPSPGISLTNEFIRTASARGVGITGELDIFTKYNDLPVIAITGTNGKTTTTTLIGKMLKACNMNPFVGGNIGTPLMDNLMTPGQAKVIVAEISSFQLDISKIFKPDVAVLLNTSEDHLNRYENQKAYEDSKWSIFKNQTSFDKAVINRSIKGFDKRSHKLQAEIFTFASNDSTKTDVKKECHARINAEYIELMTENVHHRIDTAQIKGLAGAHNRENIAAAVLSCLGLGADIKNILKGVENFKNLPHRIEFIKTINGVSFYNDSKATNTDAVISAVQSFNKNIILILGGQDKGSDLSLLEKDIKKSVKAIITFGETGRQIKDIFENICLTQMASTMKDAVQKAFDKALKNDVVLLSPGFSSFDMYESYVHRGNDFTNHVKALGNK